MYPACCRADNGTGDVWGIVEKLAESTFISDDWRPRGVPRLLAQHRPRRRTPSLQQGRHWRTHARSMYFASVLLLWLLLKKNSKLNVGQYQIFDKGRGKGKRIYTASTSPLKGSGITQLYLQTTPYLPLPLPRKRSPDGAAPRSAQLDAWLDGAHYVMHV